MRTQLIVICGVLMLWTSIAKGSERLGETVEQCEARYGKPIETHSDNVQTTRHYRVGVYSLLVSFYGDKALCLIYSRVDHGALTDEEIQYLLKINIQSGQWKEENLDSPVLLRSQDRKWTRDDGVEANLQGTKTQFVVISPKVKEIYDAARAAAESKRLQESRESLNKL